MSVFERGVRLGRRLALVAVWLAAIVAESRAADESLWNLPQNGTFNVDHNWFGGVPTENDLARFEITNSNSQRTYTVDFDNSPTNQQLVVEDDNVTFALNGHTYTLLNSFVAAAIGTVPNANRSGKLTVTGGTLSLPSKNPSSAADLEVAPIASATGVLTVGAGGVIGGSPDVFVGLDGNGTLDINSGGHVSATELWIGVNSNSTGVVKVTGHESSLGAVEMAVGALGGGSVEVTGGGGVSANSLTIGVYSNSTGVLKVAGHESSLSAVAMFCQGTLEVTAGGQAFTGFGVIGSGDGKGTARIAGVGSTWKGFTLYIVRQGTLDVTGGAQVMTDDLFVEGTPPPQIKVASTNQKADSILTVRNKAVLNSQGSMLIIQAGGDR